MTVETQSIYAVVPAAGVGKRMASTIPKQYLELLGKPIIVHTLEALLRVERIQKIIVMVSEHDEFWQTLDVFNDPRIEVAIGGAERSISVLNGLLHLQSELEKTDWVMVHDVVRPCIQASTINAFIDNLIDDSVGGLLAIPIADTIKRVDITGIVEETVDRESLWRAQTPQMFHFQQLFDALVKGIKDDETITDEASAIELAGYSVKVVEGLRSNLKVTQAEDLALADFFLSLGDQ